jgi:hypothetical protein
VIAIKDCTCGKDHETTPLVNVSTCTCMFNPDPDCTHEELEVPAVCVTHKRHEPCRRCIREENSTN